MKSRKYSTDPKVLLEQGKAIMTSSDESKFLFRVFAVNMVLSGTPASQVGASAGFTKAAVTDWVKTVDEKGFDALRPQQRPGRPSKLTEQQLKELDAVIQSDPKEHGLKVWDGPSLSSYIKSHYSVDIGIRQCQRLFRRLGYSHIRPQPYPSKGYEDTEERKAFKKKRDEIDRDTCSIFLPVVIEVLHQFVRWSLPIYWGIVDYPVQVFYEWCSIIATLFGIVMLVRLLQLKNACLPILVTLSGMGFFIRLLQSKKAKSLILVTPSSIMISIMSSLLHGVIPV